MSDESSFDFSVEEIEDEIAVNSVFKQPAVLDSPPVFVAQVKSDEVEDIDFDSSFSESSAEAFEDETETETPAKNPTSPSKKLGTSFTRRLRLPVLNKDTVLAHTYDLEYTLNKRVQREATAPHRFHQSHYKTTLNDYLRHV